MITQLKLDESAKLEFGVSITGADSQPSARFIIEGKDFSIMIPCTPVNESVEVQIPALKNILPAGEYSARLEVLIDNKLYTPMNESIVFEPSIEIATKQKPVAIKESVKVGKIVVKKKAVDESVLRKTQAAMIIAQSLGYVPLEDETPKEVIEHAIQEKSGALTQEQIDTVNEMINLAESVGVEVDVVIPSRVVISEVKQEVKTDDEESDEELDKMISNLDLDDYINTYEDDDFVIVDTETGEILDENIQEQQLNEVLSRSERLKARIRMARNKTKREIKARMALRKHSSTSTINHRARRMAVKAMEKKLAKNRPLDQLSVSEKERIERIIQRRKNVLSRLALKLVPHVRQVEKDRLAHTNVTQ